MHLEEFAEGKSLWHRMDPRVKILGLFSFAIVTAVSGDLSLLVLAACAALTALLFARLDWKQLAVRFGALNGFIAFLWLFLPFTTAGEVLTRWGWLEVHREGILLSLAITLKANAIAAATVALLGTSGIFDLVHALTHLRIPGKLVQLFFFSYRYISVIHQEYSRLRAGMRIRCFRPRLSVHTFRSLANLLGMLFVRSWDRSETIYKAMLLRGFAGTFWTIDHFHMHRSDWVAAVAMGAFVLFMIGVQIP